MDYEYKLPLISRLYVRCLAVLKPSRYAAILCSGSTLPK
jgi:hypothetical protein